MFKIILQLRLAVATIVDIALYIHGGIYSILTTKITIKGIIKPFTALHEPWLHLLFKVEAATDNIIDTVDDTIDKVVDICVPDSGKEFNLCLYLQNWWWGVNNKTIKIDLDSIMCWADTRDISPNIIPRTYKALLAIDFLELSDIKVGYLPTELKRLICLNYVNVSNTGILELPRILMASWAELGWLDISHNQINSLQNVFHYVHKLEILAINNTLISELPISLRTLPKLRAIYYNDMPNLKTIPIDLIYLPFILLQNEHN